MLILHLVAYQHLALLYQPAACGPIATPGLDRAWRGYDQLLL